MELEFEKYCVVDGSPKTVLPSPRHSSKLKNRKARGKPKCGSNLLIEKDFTEISFRPCSSASCKGIPYRATVVEANEGLKRSSVYQSSKEVREMKKMGTIEGRRKIELPRSSSATAFSFGIVDSLCSSDEDSSLIEQNKSSVVLLNLESNSCISKPQMESCSRISERDDLSDAFLEISLDSDKRENQSPEVIERQRIGLLSGGSGLWERDNSFTLHKSLSSKLALPHSPSRSESDCSKPSSPKTRFSPIRRMFDPFVKSKSQRSPLGSAIGLSRSKTSRKSLLHDFSNTLRAECDPQFVKKESLKSPVPCSPAHLHGLLKLESKHGVPFFEFSVKFPEEVLVAKTWKVGNGLNWVYTFHAVHDRRKGSVSGWGLKDSYKESSMVGQMQVSCYLCSELKDAGAFNNSMVTEFVLYDIAQVRKSVSGQGNSYSFPNVAKPPKGSNENSNVGTCDSGHNDSCTNPWAQMELHPNLEVAAIVIQVPFEKRESLTCKRGDRESDEPLPNFLDLSGVERREKGFNDCLSPTKVNVVTPCGNHSFPTAKSGGPSPLLDRWRLGGGCDCGGWDMGCPLVVFGNLDAKCAKNYPLAENQRPMELFVQGTKDRMPALTMRVSEEGQYAVDFHAQLTTLQAFAICVSILHSTEASIAVGEEREKQLLQCDSLRVFIGQEVKNLIEAVTEEEKQKTSKKMEETTPSFVLNPPFSPIARV